MKEPNVLIIDGLGASSLMATQILPSRGVSIMTASNVEDGQRLLNHYRPELVIVDCQVTPDPVVWVEEIRRLGLDSHVLAVTEEEDFTQALDWVYKGVYNVLKRPVDPERFLRLALGALASQAVLQKKTSPPQVECSDYLKNRDSLLSSFYSSLIGHLDPNELHRQIVESVKKLTGARQVQLWLVGTKKDNTPENTKETYKLVHDHRCYGELRLYYDPTIARHPDQEPTAEVIKAITSALKATHNYRKAVELGSKDCLTGLCNRRIFNETLEWEFAKAQRHNLDLSLIMIDIDHFKKVNDNYGHQTGDSVLQIVAHLISQVARNTDLAARVGGEEFIMLLPHTSQEQALELAQRLQKIINQYIFNFNGITFYQTISQGVVDLEHFLVNNPGDMIYWADQAMYLAKREGRDTIRTASDISIAPALNEHLHTFQ